MNEIPIVNEFLEVFKDVPGLPPDRKIKFTNYLVPGTNHLSKAPYQTTLAKLAELNVQLQELSDKGQSSLICLHGEPQYSLLRRMKV